MSKEFVYYVLSGRCRKFGTSVDPSVQVEHVKVVVRFKNENRAEYSQLGQGFEDVHQEFQAGLPKGWVMWLDDSGLEVYTKLPEEEARMMGFVIVE